MATKKTQPAAEEVKEEEVKEEVKEEPVAEVPAEKDPWQEMVSVFVPRARKGEDQNAYVCVNDRRYSIPRNGKNQEMPRPIAEVLQMSMTAQYEADEYAESIHVNEAAPGAI